jgi:hypothetical protein
MDELRGRERGGDGREFVDHDVAGRIAAHDGQQGKGAGLVRLCGRVSGFGDQIQDVAVAVRAQREVAIGACPGPSELPRCASAGRLHCHRRVGNWACCAQHLALYFRGQRRHTR